MKVLFVTRGFPSEKDPMAGNYETVQAKAIAAKGHEVSVIAIDWRNLLHIFERKKVTHRVVDGINVYECKRIKPSIPHLYLPKLEQRVKQWQFKKVFLRYLQEMGMPDIVHAHIVILAAPAIILKNDFHLPFVITEHWSRVFESNTLRRILNDMFAYKDADAVISVSEVLAKSIKEKCGVDSLIINNMVTNQFFESRRHIRKDNSFRFIAVGGLRRIKRFDLLVEAFSLCHFPLNVSLEIVGEGEERHLIETKIHEYNVYRQVKLLGLKTPKEVNDLLCQSDCFVLSSKLETFSIVLIEAMAKGLPVIATRCGGPETFVRPKDGILVPKENVEEFAKAMKYMVDHYQDYNADEIRQYCQDNFSQDVIADKIIDVYKQVLNKN